MRLSWMIFWLLLVPTRMEAGEWGGRIRLQVTQEYDTNVHRVFYSLPQPTDPYDQNRLSPDGLTRLLLQGLVKFSSEQHQLTLNYTGGLKLFHHQTSENLLANQADGAYAFSLNPQWSFGGRVLFQDTTLSFHDRDYNLIGAETNQRYSPIRPLVLEMYQGVRYFHFKPDNADDVHFLNKYTHWGPVLGTRFQWFVCPEFVASLYYQVDWRFFGQQALDQQSAHRSDDRLDTRHEVGLRLRLEIPYWNKHRLILEANPVLAFNQSNSWGSTLHWQRLRLLGAIMLPWDTSLQLMGTLQHTTYVDGMLLDPYIYEPDADENENSLALRLSHRFYKGLSVIFQGAIYRNDFRSSAQRFPFQRETLMLGLAYDLSL